MNKLNLTLNFRLKIKLMNFRLAYFEENNFIYIQD